ncbi:MAG: hypothetical protein HQL74_04865 [Magnetococcales bacterium]|nr:hypothetical protein [Magnetococcales bacterium]
MPKIPMTEQKSSWSDMITVRSRECPRDAVQLINELSRRAIMAGQHKINEELFASEMINFSKQRVSLLAQEAEFECPELADIIRGFYKIDYDYESFKATAELVKATLSDLPSSFSIRLYGRTLQPNNDESVFDLWKYLFDVGFLNARVSDKRNQDGFRHIYPHEEPNYVAKTRWNVMQATIWEIGPSYRDFLISYQKEMAAKTGLPPKRKSLFNTRR